MQGRWLRFGAGVAMVTLAVFPAGSAAALIQPERAFGQTNTIEYMPFANELWLAWAQNSYTQPDWFNAYAESFDGDERVKINAPRTFGWPGNFEPGTNTIIYQQASRNSQLYVHDLDTHDRSPVPDVNTPGWEWSPRISSRFVLFDRDTVRDGVGYTTLWLYNRNTRTMRKLEEWRDANLYTPTGGVGDSYATYTVCSRRTCSGFVYSIADRTTRRIPTLNRRPVYAPIVDEVNGDLYFFRSGFGCGVNVALWRLPVDNLNVTPAKIGELDQGFDSYSATTSLAASTAGSQDLYFDRAVCRTPRSDLWVFRDVTSEPDVTMRVSDGRSAHVQGGLGRFQEAPEESQR